VAKGFLAFVGLTAGLRRFYSTLAEWVRSLGLIQ